MKIHLLIVSLFLFCGTSVSFGKTMPFKAGETIHYSIRQMGVKVGEAELTFQGEVLLNDQPAYLIIFNSQGIKFYDKEMIYVDQKNFRPIKVIRDLKIFSGVEQIIEEYKPTGEAFITKTAGGKTTTQTVFRGGPVDNIYGFIYRFRQQKDLEKQKKFDIKLPTVDIEMSVGRSVSFVAGGKKYQASLLTSVPSKYTLWMDESDLCLPLRIAGSVGITNTVMTMISYTP